MKKIVIVMLSAVLLTGCVQQTDLTQQEIDSVTTYAANVTLKYDRNYAKKLVNEQEVQDVTNEENTEIEDVSNDEEALNKETNEQVTATSEIVEEEATEEAAENKNIASILTLDGFNITYKGYDYGKEYEDVIQEKSYSANSIDGYEFLILNFEVQNTTNEIKNCDVLSLSPKLKVSVNGNEPINTFASLLSNDLSTLFEEIEPNTTKDVVLLVELPQDYVDEISNISLTAIVNGTVSTVELN